MNFKCQHVCFWKRRHVIFVLFSQTKLTDEAIQDTVMSIDDKGKMAWRVEVEPPQNMDETDYDIDPSMKIWKSMRDIEQDKQPWKAEEDLDDLRHPSVVDLKVQTRNMDADIQAEPWQEVSNMKYNPEPELDMDEVYHKALEDVAGYLAPLRADFKAGEEARVEYSEPEKDEDEMYHRDDQSSSVQMEELSREVMVQSERVRVHLEPEEDMDDLYHKDVLQPIPYQGEPEAADPVYFPSQRKYSEPEEDLDGLYHQ
ncbi:uncharacterized protein si:ch211-217g15.3 isoform X1 [Centropristis striata]|uniref:uncharacterized protein si:ch211-217g15.3 isoform X1 n=2 Tax=Centropristis striata TaxID=184440 RepID=UPI0027E13C2C|nr:uncharacterized protein si:ch211-217g15.3 isoform X1 [Centropristis striata]